MDIIYLIKVLIKRKWTIIFCLILGLAGGFLFRLLVPRQYVSTAQYSTGFAQTQKVSLQLTEIFDVNQIEFRFNNVIETFKSPIVLGMMSYDLLLHDLDAARPFRILTEKEKRDTSYQKADFGKAREILHDKLNTLQILSTFDPEQKKVWDLMNLYKYDEETILKYLTVERVPKTDYISISFRSENPELSAYIVNTIGVKFKEFYNAITATNTQQSLHKLDSLRESKKREVDELRKKLQDFRGKIGTPNPGDAATAAMSGLQELTSSLLAQQASLNDSKQKLNSVIDQLSSLNSNSTTASAPTNNADEILQLRKANDALAAQLSQKGGNDPDLQNKIDANLQKIIALRSVSSTGSNSALKLQEKKDELIKQKLELIANISSTNENIELYKKRVEEFRKTAFSGGGEEVVANAYQNDLATAQKDLEKYNSSLFASQDIDVAPDFNFKQTLLGQPAIKPEPAHGLLITSIAGLSMFFLACLFIIILELLDSSLRTPTIFQKETRLNVLAVVNHIELQKKTLQEFFDFNSKSDREHTSNPYIENLRKLRFEIENSGKKIILVTSLKSGEGKSTILESLAYTFSMSKKKVLLIDANFKNNSLTRQFSAKPTLEEYAASSSSENAMEKVWGITTITNITNTDIVGCNEGNYTPSEVLPKNNLLSQLNRIIEHYDFIFVEAAALNEHADSKELAQYVNGIIVVFSAKSVVGELDKESIHYLKGEGTKFIGAVLNNVDEQNMDL